MTVLHVAVSWRRASRAGGQLLFWGEADEPPPEAGGRVAIGLRRYPAAMDPEALDAATEAYARAIGVPFPRGSFEVTRFYLPTRKGRPLGSGPSAGSSKGPERGVDRLSPWAVPARRVSYVEALPWLAALPIGAEAEDLPRMGGDLRYLSRVAKFVLGLLVRRRIVPVLAEGSTGAAEGRWRASLATDEELAEGERLKRLTPASLTAVRGEAKPPGPGSLIRALLDEGVDGLARSWLAEGPPAPRHDLPEGRWAAALTSPRPLLELPRAQRGELREGVEAWTGQPVDEPARYRTCFRLDAPRPDGEDGDEAVDPLDTSEGAWRLEALLQARDDPSELILAVDAVADPRSLPRRAGQDSRTVVDGLLGDLHRAGRIHPPIAGLLAHRLPSALSISTAEAYDFLRTAGPLLAECGFGLLVPPWWSTRRPPLGAKLKIRPTAAEGQFGLDALLQYDLVVALGDRLLSREELDRLARLKVPLVRYRGRWVEIRPEDVAGAVRAFEQRTRGTLTLREVLSADVEGRLGGLPILGVIPSEGLRELWTALRGDVRFEEIVPPAELRATLRPYQLRGYSWLTFWHRLGLGACLADDMGLGKTVQCLAALLGSRPSGAKGAPALLVCPTSVIENWRRETEQFAPSLAVRVHHGEDRPRRPSAFAARYRSVDVVVTSYALLWRDAELLRSRAWDTVVLDEAQNIKNPLAKASQSAFALRARHRVALTGTPVENRLSELWSIMQFLNPGLLGPLATFEARFATPIERFSDGEAARTLQRLIRPLVLRRLKSDPEIVPDLPEKIEIRTDCSLTPEQASLYEATVREMLERIEGSEGIDRRARI
ncbi:MAG: DEAD/DEAH box helicase, partial [Thermoplasmata archaeon]